MPLLLLLACALPHGLRAAWPLTEFGSGEVLLAARRLSTGTYSTTLSDGPLWLERVLGLTLDGFGGAPRAIELLGIAVVLLTAMLLRRLGTRLAGPWAGAAAALVWSFNPWVLHLHVFDRGLLAAPATVLAVLWLHDALLDRRARATRRVAWLVGALVACVLIDQPWAWPPVGIVAGVACLRGRVGLGLAIAVGLPLFVGALTWGASLGATQAAAPLYELAAAGPLHDLATRATALAVHADLALIAALVGGVLMILRRPRGPAALPVLWLVFELLRALSRLPGDGAGAMIAPALPAALLVGLSLEAALGSADATPRREGAGLRNVMAVATAVLMAVVIFDLFGTRRSADSVDSADATGVPTAQAVEEVERYSLMRAWITDRWRPPQLGYGLFSGRPRAHLDARVKLLTEHSDQLDGVAGAWAWEAAMADRPAWSRDAQVDSVLLLEPLPDGLSMPELEASGRVRVVSSTDPDIAAWWAPPN